jgi:hypothetical protein
MMRERRVGFDPFGPAVAYGAMKVPWNAAGTRDESRGAD